MTGGGGKSRRIYMHRGKLYVYENGTETEISISTSETSVRVGCTGISREAFEYILRTVRGA